MVWYVVHVGRQTGVFSSWDLAHTQVVGYSGACRKKYKTKEEADAAFYGLPEEQEVQPAYEVPEEEEMEPVVPVLEAKKPLFSVKDVIILVLALIIVLLLFKLL